jgi:hypothetical protein
MYLGGVIRRHARTPAIVDLGLLYPFVERLCPSVDLGRNRHDCRPHRDGCSPSWSTTIRTARARTSGENLLLVCFVMAPPSQELEPPINPGRFSLKFSGILKIEYPCAEAINGERMLSSL